MHIPVRASTTYLPPPVLIVFPGVGFDYRGLGITPFDRKFLDGAQCRSDLEKANIESESDDGHPLKRSRKL